MVPRIAQRFGVHTRAHAIRLCAHLARRLGIFCLVVAALLLLGSSSREVTLPVASFSGTWGTGEVQGLVTSPAAPPGATVHTPDTSSIGRLSISFPATTLERLLAAAPGWLGWASVGAALVWLAPLLRGFAEGDPFAPGNAGRLRGIAGAAFVVTHVVPLLTPLTAALALHRLGASGWTPDWGFPVHSSLVFVLLLFLLAGALDVGRRLQVDSEGLV
ncbi:hypothetical protein GCM10027519_27950 [Kineococcus endophyticus]